MIDLHVHTIMSDGQHTPAEIIHLAARKNLSAVSITDHDTISGIEEGILTAKDLGLKFVPGIKISVQGNKELHILGYWVDMHNEDLRIMCEGFEKLRKERERRIFEYLRGKGIELSEEQVKTHVNHGRVGRPHFARAMVEAGHVSDYREAFNRYLGNEEFDRIERPKPRIEEGVNVIKNAGGVAVLAHPALLKLEDGELENLIVKLIQAGIKGIECHYSTHTKNQTAFYLSLSKKYGLLVTGGSDYHGEKIKPDIELGTGINNSLQFSDISIIEKLLEAAGND